MHSIVTTFRVAVIKVDVANFCAALDTLIDQDAFSHTKLQHCEYSNYSVILQTLGGRFNP